MRKNRCRAGKVQSHSGRRERWLVLNKLDLIPENERAQRVRDVVEALGWKGPVFDVSALTGGYREKVCQAIMRWLDNKAEAEKENPELAEQEKVLRETIDQEAREKIEAEKEARKARRLAEKVRLMTKKMTTTMVSKSFMRRNGFKQPPQNLSVHS